MPTDGLRRAEKKKNTGFPFYESGFFTRITTIECTRDLLPLLPLQNIQQQLQMQRIRLDRYLSQIHQTRENFTANVHAAAEKNTRARMALLQVAQNEGLVPTDEEITKNLQERADRTKKTLEEVKANANIPAMQRSEAIRRAADWVIEHSTIEEK